MGEAKNRYEGVRRFVVDRLRAIRRRLSRGSRSRRTPHDPYDDNPLPLGGAILAALSGLFPRRRRDEREPHEA